MKTSRAQLEGKEFLGRRERTNKCLQGKEEAQAWTQWFWHWARQSCLIRDTPALVWAIDQALALELTGPPALMGRCIPSHTWIYFQLSWACEPPHKQNNDLGDFDHFGGSAEH